MTDAKEKIKQIQDGVERVKVLTGFLYNLEQIFADFEHNEDTRYPAIHIESNSRQPEGDCVINRANITFRDPQEKEMVMVFLRDIRDTINIHINQKMQRLTSLTSMESQIPLFKSKTSDK